MRINKLGFLIVVGEDVMFFRLYFFRVSFGVFLCFVVVG